MTLQNYGAFDQALIQLLADSRCPGDHLNLVKHIYNRPGPQSRLLQLAERDRNHHKAASRWPLTASAAAITSRGRSRLPAPSTA